VVAHRLSTIRQANRILVIDKGRVAEHGTHDALILQGGIYADLWHVQTGLSIDK
jgi:ABC-type multidrug transport system fused ATPase/permease subunit